MTASAIESLTKLLRSKPTPVVEAKKNVEPEPLEVMKPEDALKQFDSFMKVLNKEFGKDNIISTEANSQMLKVVLTRAAYTSNQAKFDVKGREAWLNDEKMAILSVMPDVEPESTKIYFCKIQTLNSPE